MATKIVIPPRRGSRHGAAKLNEAYVIRIRNQAHTKGWFPIAETARQKKVTYRTLRDALRGATYTHVNKIAKPFRGPSSLGPTGCVVRIDSESTHGWQARYQGRSKFFSDSKHGRMAEGRARRWLKEEAD